MQHVPATELIFEPTRDNNQSSLRSCTGKNKMAAIGSGARVAALTGTMGFERENWLMFWWWWLMMKPFQFSLSFSRLSHRIGLSLKWAIRVRVCNISVGHVPATFSCLCKCCVFVPATCPSYTSLLHVLQCVMYKFLSLLHVAATCPCYMTPRVCPP